MAEQINLKVDLQSNLQELVGATKAVKLDKGQSERVERYAKGAQLALDSGDLKTFQHNFNNLLKLFKDAAAATGKVSEEIQKLTARQAALNKEINQLKDQKTKLETHTSDGKLTKTGADAYYKESKDAAKVIKSDGTQATRDEIIKFQEALVKVLKEAKHNFQTMTKEDVATAASNSKVDINSRSAAQATNRYVKGENAYAASLPGQINATNADLNTKEQEYATLTAELTRMTEAAGNGAESIEKLYAAISKLGDDTNKAVTDLTNKKKKEKADKTPAKRGENVDLPNFNKQNSSIGGAFKQLTLYHVALRAVKTALREAVQTVKELDKFLTEQAMVTGKTREETYALIGSYQDLAAQCGATTKEIAQVATEYMKQGKTIEDSLVLTEAAVKAAKVARVSVGDSVNYLTTALNGFRLEADQAMAVSDKFAAVAASSATDYDELAIALSKVASQANLAGMSIDYTTALLTKGLETTREAPETMGTALKTIIARMRELGDYGETLDDGMDINNVESQLKYVGIELRNQQGELRSTEEVLDELGKKWDTLNKNQQAAVAKALAGTRQQSRLIAMMEDYERVTELQEISQRSAGATSAQAGVYLEGMEAALNKIQVAWEKIVMTVTDSEFIISGLEFISNLLDSIGDFLSTDFGLVATLTTVLGLTMSGLTAKMQEAMYAKTINGLEQQKQALKLKQKQVELKQLITAKKVVLAEKQKTKQGQAQVKLEAIEQQLQNKQIDATTAKMLASQVEGDLAKDELTIKGEIAALESEMVLNEMQLATINSASSSAWSSIGSTVSMVGGGIGTLLTGSAEWLAIMTAIGFAFQIIPPIIKTIAAVSKAYNAMEETEHTKIGFLKMAGAATGLGVPGLFIAAALFTLAGITAVAALVNAAAKQESDTEKMQDLSNEIYNLTQKANALNNIADQFEEIDNKVIKTKKDMEELNKVLASAADQMDTTQEEDKKGNKIEGTSEKEKYEVITDTDKQLTFIEESAKKAKADADKKRQDTLDMINSWSNEDRDTMLDDSNKSSDALAAQSAVKTTARSFMYDYVQTLRESGEYSSELLKNTEDFTSELISNMSTLQALDFANNKTKMEDFVEQIKNINVELENGSEVAVDILQDEDRTIAERIKAYEELSKTLEGNVVAFEALKKAYPDWEELSGWEENVIEFIDRYSLSLNEVNKLYGQADVFRKQKMVVTDEEYKKAMNDALNELDSDLSNFEEVFKEHFNEILTSGGKFEDNWDLLMNSIGDVLTVTIQDMGQNMQKFKNTINDFYEKSQEWTSMSETDKMNFIADNLEIFEGKNGDEILKAFESGNYEKIQEALSNAEGTLEEQRKKRLQEVQLTLEVEKRKEKKNTAYIAALEEYEKYLEDTNNLFKASLELRLEQEKNQLDEYKSLVEKEQEALVDSLEKRKEAYEKYFEEIDKQQEDQEYEDESERLITNISKLASSGDADAKAKTMELEQELKELEAERLQALKERAREAILENMDNEVAEINDKFDKLLESNQALLAAMQGDLANPTEFLAELIGNKFTDGATKLELEDYIGNLESIYGNTLDGVDWDAIKEEIIEQLFLNVNGQDVYLNESDQQSVFKAVKKALQEIGKR